MSLQLSPSLLVILLLLLLAAHSHALLTQPPAGASVSCGAPLTVAAAKVPDAAEFAEFALYRSEWTAVRARLATLGRVPASGMRFSLELPRFCPQPASGYYFVGVVYYAADGAIVGEEFGPYFHAGGDSNGALDASPRVSRPAANEEIVCGEPLQIVWQQQQKVASNSSGSVGSAQVWQSSASSGIVERVGDVVPIDASSGASGRLVLPAFCPPSEGDSFFVELTLQLGEQRAGESGRAERVLRSARFRAGRTAAVLAPAAGALLFLDSAVASRAALRLVLPRSLPAAAHVRVEFRSGQNLFASSLRAELASAPLRGGAAELLGEHERFAEWRLPFFFAAKALPAGAYFARVVLHPADRRDAVLLSVDSGVFSVLDKPADASFACDEMSVSALLSSLSYEDERVDAAAIETVELFEVCQHSAAHAGTYPVLFSFRRGVHSVIAVADHEHKRVFLAHRGTVLSVEDWLTNLSAGYVPCADVFASRGECAGDVFWGFAAEYAALLDQSSAGALLEPSQSPTQLGLRELLADKQYTLVVTGHSQGGALAALSAFDIARHLDLPEGRVRLITFGAPRVVSAPLASQIEARLGSANIFRLTSDRDPVPYLPDGLYFQHIGEPIALPCEHWIFFVSCHAMSTYFPSVLEGKGRQGRSLALFRNTDGNDKLDVAAPDSQSGSPLWIPIVASLAAALCVAALFAIAIVVFVKRRKRFIQS